MKNKLNTVIITQDDPIGKQNHFTMDEKIEKEKIMLQDKVPIKPDDSLNDLMIKSKKDASNLVIRELEQIIDGTVVLKNYEGKDSYFTFPIRVEVRQFKKQGYRIL